MTPSIPPPIFTTQHELDAQGRPVITASIREQIDSAFAELPPFKQVALVGIADQHGPRLMTGVKFGKTWKVVGGTGFVWEDGLRFKNPKVMVVAAW